MDVYIVCKTCYIKCHCILFVFICSLLNPYRSLLYICIEEVVFNFEWEVSRVHSEDEVVPVEIVVVCTCVGSSTVVRGEIAVVAEVEILAGASLYDSLGVSLCECRDLNILGCFESLELKVDSIGIGSDTVVLREGALKVRYVLVEFVGIKFCSLCHSEA